MGSAQDNDVLTRVGPGAPMGQLMREYWVPACLSAELAADGPPLRLMLLGEKLIAFRDTSGRVGVMDHRCPHRCASLFFGRNEENGLRCIYHGWKYDVAGNCLDMPNVPADHSFAAKVRARAYPAVERGGVVWTYMGARAVAPPLPALEPLLLPEAQAATRWAQRECNWLQALEGDIDTSHFSFLHEGKLKAEDFPPETIHRHVLTHRAPEYHVADTPWGTMYAAYRPADPGNIYYRVAHFIFPFWTMIPNASFGSHVVARAWVPMDDTHTMFIQFTWSGNAAPLAVRKDGAPAAGAGLALKCLPNATDWYGRWRLTQNEANDYEIDRDVQRRLSFTGIDGIHVQDQAVTESMGAIVDRDLENLAVSDLMVARTRQRLARAARAVADTGATPPGVDDPEIVLAAHSGDFVAPASLPWQSAYAKEMEASANPTGALRVPELAAQ
jgi:phenylpropionate dioxygenase-like ring-hydroxylating dioxygenase large terminal subunit